MNEFKGQLSLEYMLTAIISLLLLSISVVAISNFSNAISLLSRKSIFLSDAHSLYDNAYEVCILGDGNARITYVRGDISISSNGEEISLKRDNYTFSSPIPCGVHPSIVNGKVYVYNNMGTIYFDKLS